MITIILIFSVLNALMTFLLFYSIIKIGKQQRRFKNDLYNDFNGIGLS